MENGPDISRRSQKMWFTLVGLVPLGVYVVLHLLTVSKSWSGAEPFDRAIAASHGSWLTWMGTVLILGLIAYHAIVGIRLLMTSTPISPAPRRLLHWQYVLQRVSALGILLFIPAHVYKAKISPAMSGHHETFAAMHHAFAVDPMRFLTVPVYLLGTAGVAYHLANGLWTACVTLGLTPGMAGQRRMRVVSALFFVFLMVLSYGTILKIILG